MPESADSRPRLGELLLGTGLITQEQLDASLTLARATGKPLGHVLVEQGLVPAHSIAMALADQHGGPLKTEFGFATGRGATPRKPSAPRQEPSAPAVLRLAPAPGEAAGQVQELMARVAGLEAELAAERETSERAAALADALNAQIEDLRRGWALDSAALSAAEEALAAACTRVTELDQAAIPEAQEHSYSEDTHFLFAPGADGYELVERSGPAPAAGELVELPNGRTCRVLRVGPPPFPGSAEACAYLELP